MSTCKTCGREEDGHWIGCEGAMPTGENATSVASVSIRREHLDEVVSTILTAVGTDQMGELYSSLGDLIHEHYEPYSWLSAEEQAAWRTAVAEKLGGEGYGDPAPTAPPVAQCTYDDCTKPRRSADKRVKFCEEHSDPKNRK